VTGGGKLTDICVFKYNDLNGNGVQDGGEPPLAGWQFTIRDSSGGVIAQGVTNANGVYCRNTRPLVPGVYTVTETLQSGWTSTNPGGATPTRTVTLAAGQTLQVPFGNRASTGKASFAIEKTVTQNCTGGPPTTLCKFIIRITNTGSGPYTGPLTFTDLVTSFGVTTGGVSVAAQPPGWSCTGAGPTTCTAIANVTIPPTGYVNVPLDLNINGAVPPDKNCASVTGPAAAGPACVAIGLQRSGAPAPTRRR
jgi:hypothetical protein